MYLTDTSWYFHMVLAANVNSYPPLMPIHTVDGASEIEALSLAGIFYASFL